MYLIFDRNNENMIVDVLEVLKDITGENIGVLKIERDDQVEDYFYYKVNAEETGIEYSEAAKEMRTRAFSEQIIFDLRQTRNKLLKETDKYALPDWPHKTPEIRQAWLDYRQALRDFPEVSDVKNPIWPTSPDEV